MRHAGGVSTHRTADLGFARLDLDRAGRTGTPEVVYAAGKTPAQTVACLEALRDGGVGARLGHPGGRRDGRGGPRALARRGRRRRGPVRVRRRAARAGRRGAGAHRRDVGRRRRRRGRRDPGRAAGWAAAAWTTSGVAGVHRVLAVAPDIADGRRRRRRRRDGRRPAQRRRRPDRPAGRRRADVGRLRRRLRGARRPADHADRLRARASWWSTSTTGSAPAWPPRGSRGPR